MKKAILILVVILLLTFLIGNAETLLDFVDTLRTGALIPIIVALVFTVFRYLTQAASYKAAFEAVGFKSTLWHNLVIILSLIFVNTFVVPAGTGSLPFIIGDAHKRGADIGTATSGALLSQIGFFFAVFVISIVGIAVMAIANSFNVVVFIGFMTTTVVLVVQVGMFIIGYYKPKLLTTLLHFVQRIINRVLSWFKRGPNEWADESARSFIDSSQVLAHNPSGVAVTILWASLSALMNMGCLISIGFAFGFNQVVPLVAAFTVAVVSIQLSPTPQGVGVAEAAITLVLTAFNASIATSAAIALVYRGIMMWIPFCIGAALLSQSGFFQDKKDPTEEQRRKDIGWISGTLVILLGLVNIGLVFFDAEFASYEIITQFIDLRGILFGPALVAGGIILVLLGIGLIRRIRSVWVITMTVIMIMGGLELFFNDTLKVGIPLIALAGWLFYQRHNFDRPTPWVSRLMNRNREAAASDDDIVQWPYIEGNYDSVWASSLAAELAIEVDQFAQGEAEDHPFKSIGKKLILEASDTAEPSDGVATASHEPAKDEKSSPESEAKSNPETKDVLDDDQEEVIIEEAMDEMERKVHTKGLREARLIEEALIETEKALEHQDTEESESRRS